MSSAKNNKSAIKPIRFEHEMIEAVEKESDNFSAYVKQAVKEKLERELQYSLNI